MKLNLDKNKLVIYTPIYQRNVRFYKNTILFWKLRMYCTIIAISRLSLSTKQKCLAHFRNQKYNAMDIK